MAHPVATADCIAWYRGDSLVDGGGGIASAWNDKTSNGFNLTANNSPQIVTSTLNGRLAARFAAAASTPYFNRATTPAQSQPLTVALIGKCTQTSDDNTAPSAFDSNATTSSTLFYDWTITSPAPGALSYFAGGTVGRTGSFVPDNTFRLFTQVENGASSVLYVDNASAVSGVNIGTNGFTGLRIGTARHAADAFWGWEGDIAELAIWNKALSSDERAALMAYYRGYYFGARSWGAVIG